MVFDPAVTWKSVSIRAARIATLLVGLLASQCVSPVFGDSCIWSRSETAVSSNGRFTVVIRYNHDARSWGFTWADAKTDRSSDGAVAGLESHAHPMLFVTSDGSRFAVADLSAGHRLGDRILLYESSGKLIRSLGIGDILLFHERDQISHSVSHCDWTGYDRAHDRWVWTDDEKDALYIVTQDASRVTISLRDGTVTRTPWILNWIPHVPYLWFGFAGLLLLTRIGLSLAGVVGQSFLLIDVSITVALMMGGLVLGAWETSLSFFGRTYTSVYICGGLSAICSLLLVWTTIGAWRWPVRLPVALFGLSSLLTTIALISVFKDANVMSALLGLSASMLVMLALLAGTGFGMVHVKAIDAETAARVTTLRHQYRLSDLLLWTMSIALFVAAARCVIWREIIENVRVEPFFRGAVYSLVGISVTWTALANQLVWRRFLVLIVLLAAIYVVSTMTLWQTIVSWQWATSFALFLICLLIIFRIHGYRMIRMSVAHA